MNSLIQEKDTQIQKLTMSFRNKGELDEVNTSHQIQHLESQLQFKNQDLINIEKSRNYLISFRHV